MWFRSLSATLGRSPLTQNILAALEPKVLCLSLCQDTYPEIKRRYYSAKATSNQNVDTTVPTVDISNRNLLNVQWPANKTARFHSEWLRHNCHCEQCRQPMSGQISIDVMKLPAQLTLRDVIVNDGNVEITWKEGDHQGIIPVHYLYNHRYNQAVLEERDVQLRTKRCSNANLPQVEFCDISKAKGSTAGLLRLMTHILDEGVCLIEKVPYEEDSAREIAEVIAQVQPTIYGETFDVVSTDEPINIAYSSVGLDLHMDLAYYESPPGLQIFHSLEFDDCVEGGESLLLDAFHVAEKFRQQFPEDFENLTRIPATFQKIHFSRERPVYMTYQRPHITLNHRQEINGIFWSPAFEGPLSVPEEDVDPYYKAYRQFTKLIHDPELLMTKRLQPGTVMMFNNRRLLHGRAEFKLNGGRRRLKGVYVNIDEFKSHFRYLSHVMGDGHAPTRVGNQCMF